MRIDGSTLRADLISGTTVFTVLVPSAMAYGQLAGVTPEAGMYAGLVAMIVYAILGSSRHLIVGPEATSALLAAVIVGPIAGAGAEPERFAFLVAALAALVGVILIAGGLARIGFLADFLPRAVLTGYITGAALLVIQSQLGKLFRIKFESDGFFRSLWELVTRVGETHVPTLLLGVATIAALFVLRRFVPKVPSSLVVLAASIALSAGFGWQDHGIKIVGEVTAGLPSFGLPRVSLVDFEALLPGTASMALLAFSDAVLTGRSFAARHGYAINANRELIALGAANLGTAVAGAFPVAASGSRTAVNDSTGAKSKLSGAIAAVMMIVFLLFFTPVLVSLPLVVLGAIIIVSSLGMIEIGELVRMYRFRWETFVVAIVTLLGVIVVGIVPGILVAVTMSLFMLIGIISRPNDMHLVRDGDSLEFRPIGDGPLAQIEPGLAVYRLNGLLIFANCGQMKSRVSELIAKSGAAVRALVLDLEMSSTTDLTSLAAIEELHDELSKRGVRLMAVELNTDVRELFRRAGTNQKLGDENIHADVASAVSAFQATRAKIA
jgi:SulP family sulfate permease